MSLGWSPASLVLATLLGVASEPTPPGSRLVLEVALPPDWQLAARIVLVLENVVTPRGQAFKVRVSAAAKNELDVNLGGFGIVADAPGAAGARPPVAYRVDVTRGLRRWGELHRPAKTVTLALVTLDAGSRPIPVSWRVGHAFLSLRPDAPATTRRERGREDSPGQDAPKPNASTASR